MATLHKRSVGEIAFDVINGLFLIFLCIVMLYPLVHVLFASVSNGYELMAHQGLLIWPKGFSLEAYSKVFSNPMITRGFLNTFFVLFVGVGVNLLMTSMAAYVLSRKNVYWRNFMMKMIVFTMFFQGGLVPFFLQVKALGLLDTLWSVIFAFSISAFNMIIMRTYFAAIPDSLEESAKMDGANDFTVLFRIILPVAKPVVATMLLYYGVSRWNGYFFVMIFLNDRTKYTISLILREILIANSMMGIEGGGGIAENMQDNDLIIDTIKFATTIVATVPILLVYPFLQKYFVKGAMIGSVKG
jgi:putative aldouronate transport system permease protein